MEKGYTKLSIPLPRPSVIPDRRSKEHTMKSLSYWIPAEASTWNEVVIIVWQYNIHVLYFYRGEATICEEKMDLTRSKFLTLVWFGKYNSKLWWTMNLLTVNSSSSFSFALFYTCVELKLREINYRFQITFKCKIIFRDETVNMF